MILKAPDAKYAAVTELEKLFLAADKKKQAAIAHELYNLRAAIKNETESAYQINFHLRHSQNTIVIHDLRLKLDNSNIVHIDHLLIHRSYRFYILDSRHFSYSVKIDDRGEFMRWNEVSKVYEPIPSPLKQNEEHAAALRLVLESLGLQSPHIQSFVMIGPHAHIARPQHFDSELVVHADQFLRALSANLENASFLGLLTGPAQTPMASSASDIAEQIIALHQPAIISYADEIWGDEIFPAAQGPEPEQPSRAHGFKVIT